MAMTLQDFKAELFRTMANPVRIRILETLRASGSLAVGEIQQRVGAEPSNVSQHLAIMRSRGIVTAQRDGTTVRYSVAEPEIYALLDSARSIFDRQLSAQMKLVQAE